MVLDIGKYGTFLSGLIRIELSSTSKTALLQKNPFTERYDTPSPWCDFIYIQNSIEHKQQILTKWIVILSVVMAVSAVSQLIQVFLTAKK